MKQIEEINIITKKNPSWRRVFCHYYEKDSEKNSIPKIKNTFNLIIKYNNLINKEITPNYALSLKKEGNKAEIENLEDNILKLIKEKKRKKIFDEIEKGKYSSLFNDENKSLLNEIMEISGVDSVKNDVFKKIAKYKNSEDLNEDLKKHINVINNWNKDFYIRKIGSLKGANVISDKDGKLLVEIKDYEASKEIGSKDWCISYAIEHFESYTGNLNRQYFLYDFNKDILDNTSMIGVTVDCIGRIEDAYLKNDYYVDDLSIIDVEFKKLEKNEIDDYIREKSPKSKGEFFHLLAKLGQWDRLKDQLAKNKERLVLGDVYDELTVKNNHVLIKLLLNDDLVEIKKDSLINSIKIIAVGKNKELIREIIENPNTKLDKTDFLDIFRFMMRFSLSLSNLDNLLYFLKIFRGKKEINDALKYIASLYGKREFSIEEENIIFLYYASTFENEIHSDNLMKIIEKPYNKLLKEVGII